ncbi:MAG: aldo/keto reductase [Devosia sp.]|uniref:aldo/keto reductase n=1 Tax=Devosia sp. TaxID=1871048 RepID=UPI001AD317F2|nr:aldo/keto reductase [Devosia sp.]MBN9315662.1 aldo/keto reductase [Devosia sp.]
MQVRPFGKSDLKVSALGFGCGAVGGLLVKGDPSDMLRAVARAVDLGVTYFDTAASYGAGSSEANLGLAVRETGADVVIGTKIKLAAEDRRDIENSVTRHVEASLRRLGRDAVDLIQVHNFVSGEFATDSQWLSVEEVAEVITVFARLRDKGKVRYWGINGLGDVAAVHRCAEAEMHGIQVCYNLLNPTAGLPAPPGFPFPDHRQLIAKAAKNGIGVLAIRVLAGGALSGQLKRHSHATAEVEPISSGESYDADVRLSQRLIFLVEEGFADSLIEAAIRFAISNDAISSAVLGLSDLDQLEAAARSIEKGPLPAEAVTLLQARWAQFGTT